MLGGILIKTCMIGISGYGRMHYDFLCAAEAQGRIEMVGATVINQEEEVERCAELKKRGCRLFTDYQVMLQELSGLAEFCVIPTGTPLHRPMAVAALEAGMHVLVEKPLAGCLQDAEAMILAARKTNRLAAVGYQHLYTAAAMGVKEHILNGTIGQIQSIKSLAMWPRPHSYYLRNGWAGKLSMNGTAVNDTPFNNAVAHDLMMMLFQAGPATRVAATPVKVAAALYRANAIESADTACMHVETAEGIPIRFYTTHACRERVNPTIHIQGSKGTIVMRHEAAVISPDDATAVTIPTGGAEGGRQAMFDAVLDALQGGASFICDFNVALCQTMVVDAIHRTCAIQPVDGKISNPGTDKAATFIPGIEAAMTKAFEEESLLHAKTNSIWTSRNEVSTNQNR